MELIGSNAFWIGVISATIIALLAKSVETIIPIQIKRFYTWLDLRKITKNARERIISKTVPLDDSMCPLCNLPMQKTEVAEYTRSFKDDSGNLVCHSVTLEVCPICKSRVKPILKDIEKFFIEYDIQGLKILKKFNFNLSSEIAPDNMREVLKKHKRDIITGNVYKLDDDWKIIYKGEPYMNNREFIITYRWEDEQEFKLLWCDIKPPPKNLELGDIVDFIDFVASQSLDPLNTSKGLIIEVKILSDEHLNVTKHQWILRRLPGCRPQPERSEGCG